ncbi:MAG: serine/threonine-protein kinase [Gaiella sp.]
MRSIGDGAQSSVLLARSHRRHGELCALKVYNADVKPNVEVLARVQAAPRAHVVRVYDFGEDADLGWWEELEFVEAGSLEDLIRTEGPKIEGERLREMIREIAEAVSALDGLWHRDLKPANILVRSQQPLDLVLGDFGIAEMSHARSMANGGRFGTGPYLSPEGFMQASSAKSDWWAVGMMIAEAAAGAHPFFDTAQNRMTKDAEIGVALTTRPVPLGGVEDERINLLCRGLLTRDPKHRWGADQISEWERGESPTVHAETFVAPIRRILNDGFAFNGEVFRSAADLAQALAAHWQAALQLVSGLESQAPQSVALRDWLKDGGLTDALHVVDRGADGQRGFPRLLFQLIRALAPDLKPAFRGVVIDTSGLVALADLGSTGDGEALAVVHDLRQGAILSELAREAEYGELASVERKWFEQVGLLGSLRERFNLDAMDANAERVASATLLHAALDPTVAQRLMSLVESRLRETRIDRSRIADVLEPTHTR